MNNNNGEYFLRKKNYWKHFCDWKNILKCTSSKSQKGILKSQDSPEKSICLKNMKFLHCSLLFTCNFKQTLEITQSTMIKVTKKKKVMVREITKLKAFIRIIKKWSQPSTYQNSQNNVKMMVLLCCKPELNYLTILSHEAFLPKYNYVL